MALSATKRTLVYSKTGLRCWYCGYEPQHTSVDYLTIDHVIPKTYGGSDRTENLVPACRSCNSSKGNKGLEDFRRHVSLRENEIPYFTGQQVEWLSGKGFQMPKVPVHMFWGEEG